MNITKTSFQLINEVFFIYSNIFLSTVDRNPYLTY